MMYFIPMAYWNEREVDHCITEMKARGVDSVCIPFYEHQYSWDASAWYAGKVMGAGLRLPRSRTR